MIDKIDNIYEIIDDNAKVVKLKCIFKISKKNKSDVFYAAIAKELLVKRTNSLNEEEFSLLKLKLYNAIYSINVIDTKDELLFLYQVSFINPKFVPDFEIKQLLNLFDDFIHNHTFDEEYINSVLDMENLELIDILQDYRQLAAVKNRDNLFETNNYYLNFEENKSLIDSFDIQQLIKFINKIKIQNPSYVYIGPKTLIDTSTFIIKGETLPMKYYDLDIADDVVVNLGIKQAVININFKLLGYIDQSTKSILNQMIGSGSSSILFKEIREKLNLCYYIYSTFVEENVLSVSISTSIDKIEDAINNINNIILNLDNYINEELFNLIVDLRCEKLQSYKSNKRVQEQLVISNIMYGKEYQINKLIASTKKVKYSDIKLHSNKFSLINKTIVR